LKPLLGENAQWGLSFPCRIRRQSFLTEATRDAEATHILLLRQNVTQGPLCVLSPKRERSAPANQFGTITNAKR
jgi:hypothetical protein